MTSRPIDIIQHERPALNAGAAELIKHLAARRIYIQDSTATIVLSHAIAAFRNADGEIEDGAKR